MTAPNPPAGYRTCKPSPYRHYESWKQAWIALHPKATPAEYQAAMRKISKECGV